MAQKTSQQIQLMQKRARALAIVYLTRRPEVSVQESEDDFGFDLLVTLPQEDKRGLRQFAVQLKSVWTKLAKPRADAILRPHLRKLRRHGPFPFPVLLFLFTMEDNQAWYSWVIEPVVTDDGDFELRSHEEADCQPLDDLAIDEIIHRVDRWYDAFFARTGLAASGHRK